MENKIESVFSGFKVVEKIGSGSVADVYKIESETMGVAAVKVISVPDDVNKTEMLLNQGYSPEKIGALYAGYAQKAVNTYSRMAELGTHPNMLKCDAPVCVRRTDGSGYDIFIKMEYLTPITKVIEFSNDDILRLGKDVANALVFCEDKKIIHKDIKPQNVFVAPDGKFKLGDIGVDTFAEKLENCVFVPSPDYAAPEMLSGGDVTFGSDIYSLGLVLYWLLNNKKAPFVQTEGEIPAFSEKMAARKRRLSGEALPAPANGDEWFKEAVLKACAFQPQNRYANASQLLEALRNSNAVFAENGEKTVIQAVPVPEDEKTVSINGSGIQNTEVDKNATLKIRKPISETSVDPIEKSAEPKKQERQKIQKEKTEKKKSKLPLIIGILAMVAVMLILVIVLVAAMVIGSVNETGWKEKDGVKYYYDDGKPADDGWLTIDGDVYYFYDDGTFAVGEAVIDGEYYRFDDDGEMRTGLYKKSHYYNEDGKAHKGWLEYEGNKYYCDDTGEFLTGLNDLDGFYYFFNDNGTLAVGWKTLDGNSYYFNTDGKAVTGIYVIDGEEYGFSENGVLLSGIQTVDGEKYYFGYNGVLNVGLIDIDGKTYYFNKAMVVGEAECYGNNYRFGDDGVMIKGFYKDASGKYFYYTENGVAASEGAFTLDGKRYYSKGKNGELYTNGLTTIGNARYYFTAEGVMKTGAVMIDGVEYFFGADGKLQYTTVSDIPAYSVSGTVSISGRSVTPREMNEAVVDCIGFYFELELSDYSTFPSGGHEIYVRTLDGKWVKVKTVYPVSGEKYAGIVTLSAPVSFDAYAVVSPSFRGSYKQKFYISGYKIQAN